MYCAPGSPPLAANPAPISSRSGQLRPPAYAGEPSRRPRGIRTGGAQMRRLLAALGAMAMTFALTLPAHAQTRAGNWATTELDPLPEIKADTAYTIGYWVLQHGTHPFDGPAKNLGTTGLRLIGADGT